MTSGRVRDRSTAVIGGGSPFSGDVLGFHDLRELPQGLYGSARASALAKVDREYNNNCLIIADLSSESSYGEDLYEIFGPRVIGVQICASGVGMKFERRLVKQASMWVYNVGRTHLIESFHSLVANNRVRMAKGDVSARAFSQLVNLQVEQGESKVYKTLPGHHDDLGISMCMLAFACRHHHLESWLRNAFAHRYTKPRSDPGYGWGAFT